MCLLVLLHRLVPGHPVVVGANRDERYDRGGEPPARRGSVVAPRDPEAGGTWIGAGVRDGAGLFVGIANRRDDAPEPAAPRSRGLLVADLLSLRDAGAVETALRAEDVGRYRPFAIIAADPRAALHARWDGRTLSLDRLGAGIHMVSNLRGPADFDPAPVLEAIGPLDHGLEPVLDGLAALLRLHEPGPFGRVTPCLHGEAGGTTSSALIALGGGPLVYRHAQGPPCRTAYTEV